MYQEFRTQAEDPIQGQEADEASMYQLFRGQDHVTRKVVGVHGNNWKSHVKCDKHADETLWRRVTSKMTSLCTCRVHVPRRSVKRKLSMFCLGMLICGLLYSQHEAGSVITTSSAAKKSPHLHTERLPPGESDLDPSSPRLKVLVLDMSPLSMDDTNLIRRGADFLVRTNTRETRKCCHLSISKLHFEDNKCQASVFGVNMTLKAPWNWAVYNATREAYVQGTDYFLILNDRSKLPGNWAEEYINKLATLAPPNVGIALRNSHTGGRNVLFHKTHIDIFGYIYPWYIHTKSTDNYLDNVYPEHLRVDIDSPISKMATITQGPDTDSEPWIQENSHHLNRFLSVKRLPAPPDDGKVKVISMSLYGSSRRYIEGAIRNAQVAPLYLPHWILRFYVPHPDLTEPIHVRHDVIKTLNNLGADIKYVNNDVRSVVAPMMWRFLVADDPDVDLFVVQDCDGRLGARLADGVADWLRTNATLYCMRDHPWHAASSLSGGMWGARRGQLDGVMDGQFVSEMIHYNDSYEQDMRFLAQKVWTKVAGQSYCHDSTSCERWPNAKPWPSPRRGLEHVGEIYNEYHVPFPSNRLKLNQTTQNRNCEPQDRIPG